MKRIAWMVLAAVVLLIPMGCTQPASQQYLAATRTYTGTLAALTTLGRVGMVPLADLEAIEVVRVEIARSLDRMKASVLRGDRITAEWHLREINRMLDDMLMLRIRAEDRWATTEREAKP